MTYQILAARKGKSAYTRDARDLTLASKYPSNKILIKKYGKAILNCDNGYWHRETIQHDLGYYPTLYIYYKDPATNRWIVPLGTLGKYCAVGMQVTVNFIRFHIMYFQTLNMVGDCAPCTDIGEKTVEFKYILIADPLYKP